MPQTWIDSTLVKTTFDVWNFQIWQAWKTKESVEKQELYCLLSFKSYSAPASVMIKFQVYF